jgi:uncharacterized LabA/DUF88 family protein
MDLNELKHQQIKDFYLFPPEEYGRIFAFVDFANVRRWAKDFWPEENKTFLKREIDIEKLAEIINCAEVSKKYFYYGQFEEFPNLPPSYTQNIKHRQSTYRLDKARKAGFKVRTKNIKVINDFDADGKFVEKINKCNFDVEMTMDIMQQIDNYDTVFLWSGDSDFHLLLQYLKSKKKKVIVCCSRNFLSKELQKNADRIIPADPLRDYLEYIREI